MLFFAERPEIREAQVNGYKDFVDEYELAADRLVKAASQGRRLDPVRHFPTGSGKAKAGSRPPPRAGRRCAPSSATALPIGCSVR